MSLETNQKQDIIKQFARTNNDTGSPEVQVALITKRIEMLTGHLNTHKKDNHSRRGLLKMVGQRRRLLNYMKSESEERYQTVIQALGIRR